METTLPISGSKITAFTDLKAWQEGHKLVLGIYLETKKFPKDEQFGLISQIRRAAVSITSNIAEGFGRKGAKEKAHFYSIAMGSLTEVMNQLMIARDVEYLSQQSYSVLSSLAIDTSKLTGALLRKTQTWT